MSFLSFQNNSPTYWFLFFLFSDRETLELIGGQPSSPAQSLHRVGSQTFLPRRVPKLCPGSSSFNLHLFLFVSFEFQKMGLTILSFARGERRCTWWPLVYIFRWYFLHASINIQHINRRFVSLKSAANAWVRLLSCSSTSGDQMSWSSLHLLPHNSFVFVIATFELLAVFLILSLFILL